MNVVQIVLKGYHKSHTPSPARRDERFGPVHGTWMFAYERFNSWLCRRALNRRHPEATILRTYQVMLSVSFEHKYRLYGRCTDRVLIKS